MSATQVLSSALKQLSATRSRLPQASQHSTHGRRRPLRSALRCVCFAVGHSSMHQFGSWAVLFSLGFCQPGQESYPLESCVQTPRPASPLTGLSSVSLNSPAMAGLVTANLLTAAPAAPSAFAARSVGALPPCSPCGLSELPAPHNARAARATLHERALRRSPRSPPPPLVQTRRAARTAVRVQAAGVSTARPPGPAAAQPPAAALASFSDSRSSSLPRRPRCWRPPTTSTPSPTRCCAQASTTPTGAPLARHVSSCISHASCICLYSGSCCSKSVAKSAGATRCAPRPFYLRTACARARPSAASCT